MSRVRIALALMLVAAAVVFALFLFFVVLPLRDAHPKLTLPEGGLAIAHARIYVSPDAAPLNDGMLLAHNGRIEAVKAATTLPGNARVLPCQGCTVVAGFWNSHIHFTEPKWASAAHAPAAILNAQLADMLTSRGFTTVIDLGSDLRVTLSLRRRIEAGELLGPLVYTAGSGLYPPHGIPYYLRDTLPHFVLALLPQPDTPEQAEAVVRTNIRRGADMLKLFTGSYVERGHILPMPVNIARAAVAVAHQHQQVAFAHPSNLAGTMVARDSGVDVLAHAADNTEGVDVALLQSLVARHMSLIPTLKMFGSTVKRKPAYLRPIYDEVRQFRALGGKLLFGTDVGYLTDYTTGDEFDALAESGLEWRDILRMLTTEPAERMGAILEKGTLEPGKLADFVVLQQDPAESVQAFSKVLYTVRSGRIVYAGTSH